MSVRCWRYSSFIPSLAYFLYYLVHVRIADSEYSVSQFVICISLKVLPCLRSCVNKKILILSRCKDVMW